MAKSVRESLSQRHTLTLMKRTAQDAGDRQRALRALRVDIACRNIAPAKRLRRWNGEARDLEGATGFQML